MSLKTSIYGIVKAIVGAEVVIWGNQNAPRPPLPYWSMILQSNRKAGDDWYSQGVTDAGMQTVYGTRNATLALQRYGPDSEVKVMDFRDDLSRQTVIDALLVAKIAVYDIGPVNDTTVRVDNGTLEPRASVDLMLRFGTLITDNVGIIETVISTGEYPDTESAEIVDTVTVIDT